ncbi:MAG TPA: hypothetical protein VGX69_07135 [Solirubrobacteraceae bacterium]|jgi:hypothetical protein|nr:hypothetical protein [Solirubrobacteraceae bacterium]
MRLGRARAGELVALVGAAYVIVSLFVRNYEAPSGRLDAWDTFGVGVALLILAAITAIALFVATVTERSTAIPVALEVTAIPLAFAATIAAIVRSLQRPDGATEVCFGAWLALAGAVLILIGAWRATHDEHRSLYPPATPEPRPRP